MTRIAAIRALALSGAVLAASAAPAEAACPDEGLEPTDSTLSRARAATICLINAERREAGRDALGAHDQLDGTARRHSQDMVRRSYFSHVTPSGRDLTDRVRGSSSYLRGSRSWSLAENLAWGAGSRSTPRGTVAAWMRSSGHRRNILTGTFEDIGIGIAVGAPQEASAGRRSATYTANFGRR